MTVSDNRSDGPYYPAQSIPVALPVAASTPPDEHRQSGRPGGVTARNTPRVPRAERPAERRSRQALARIRRSLSDRDLAVLASVKDHRFLTTRQLEVLHFSLDATRLSAARTSRRVLNRLAALGLLRHLDRRVGGFSAGSAAHIWAVTETGDRLLHLGDSSRNRQRYREPSERLLAHALAIGSRRIDLTLAERSGQLELIEVATEPNCWRPYLGPVGERLVLQPDLAAVTASPGSGYEDCWFIEVDLSSEHLPTVLRKCGQYEAYRRTGREQQERGTFPIVIWVMSSDTRADELARRILGTPSLDPALFRVTTPERFIPVLMGRSA